MSPPHWAHGYHLEDLGRLELGNVGERVAGASSLYE